MDDTENAVSKPPVMSRTAELLHRFALPIAIALFAGTSAPWWWPAKNSAAPPTAPPQQTVVTSQGSVAVVNGGQNITINQGSTAPPADLPHVQPRRFGLDDPNLQMVRYYDLHLEPGARMTFGPCPQAPCFVATLIAVDLGVKASLTYKLQGSWEGFNEPTAGLGFVVRVAKGCGFTLVTKEADFRFEIVDDRITSPRAILGLFPGSAPDPGAHVKEAGLCA